MAPNESLMSLVVSSRGRNSFQKASTSKGAPVYPAPPEPHGGGEEEEDEEVEELHPAKGLAPLRVPRAVSGTRCEPITQHTLVTMQSYGASHRDIDASQQTQG